MHSSMRHLHFGIFFLNWQFKFSFQWPRPCTHGTPPPSRAICRSNFKFSWYFPFSKARIDASVEDWCVSVSKRSRYGKAINRWSCKYLRMGNRLISFISCWMLGLWWWMSAHAPKVGGADLLSVVERRPSGKRLLARSLIDRLADRAPCTVTDPARR